MEVTIESQNGIKILNIDGEIRTKIDHIFYPDRLADKQFFQELQI